MPLPITKNIKDGHACDVCGNNATSQSSEGQRCVNCCEVEVRLPRYLCSKAGMKAAILAIATADERAKTECCEVENLIIAHCTNQSIPEIMRRINARQDLVTEAAKNYSVEDVAGVVVRTINRQEPKATKEKADD